MRLIYLKKLSHYFRSANSFYKFIGFLVPTVGFLAAMLSLYQAIPSNPSDGEQLRILAADCRAEGYRLLKQEKEREAKASFRCAEQYFEEAIEHDDHLSLWGISNLYGDETIQPLLATSERKDLLADAAIYWCKARHASVPHAAGNPPFIENLQC